MQTLEVSMNPASSTSEEKIPELLRVREVARMTGLAVSSIYELARIRTIPSYRLGAEGGGLRFSRCDVLEYIERCRRS